MSKFIIGFCGSVFFITCLFAIFGNPAGIVAIEGYEHGVAICGSGAAQESYLGAATLFQDEYATYVINKGHENDKEVAALRAAALIECSKY
jgi:hypothetical protein